MINHSKLEGMFRRLDEYLSHLQVLAQVAPEQLTADAIRLGAANFECFKAAIHRYLQTLSASEDR